MAHEASEGGGHLEVVPERSENMVSEASQRVVAQCSDDLSDQQRLAVLETEVLGTVHKGCLQQRLVHVECAL
eukprot:CAMPEP_0172892554 /NCGR_PEP_ID=MMETSP1075-20121228/146439_1 /TAXON_ID=2916 /ORGANISM="Ceratium fusus, Strain PA161109" /LENGTH=71 /DNA_ID=CAMNT_0013747225 /DNA_START=401 /DNA_END=612 /DNA_ORIENTATION=-